MLSSDEQGQLQQLLAETAASDNSEHIQKFKVSEKIKTDLAKCRATRLAMGASHPQLDKALRENCAFTHTVYPMIFSKMLENDAEQMQMLDAMLISLQLIEKKENTQHEASVLVGKMLKTTFVDGRSSFREKKGSWKEFLEKQPQH
jgi:hypothetical protein